MKGLLLILGIVFIILGVFIVVMSESILIPTTSEGDCFDSRQNKINGLTCEINEYPPYLNLIGVIAFFLGFTIIIFGVIISERKNE